jgi:hypothetical protein
LAFLSQLAFELLGPVFEALGYLAVIALGLGGVLDVQAAALYLGIFIAGGTLNSLMGIALETVACPRYTSTRDLALLMLYAFLENFGYRQFSILWRLEGLWNALRRKSVWGAMSRRGHQAGEATGEVSPTGPQGAAEPSDRRAAA